MTAPPGRDELSRTLRQLLDDSGLRAAEVARRTGFSQAKVSRYLNGKIVPPPSDAAALVQAMGMTDTDEGARVVRAAEAVREGTASRVVLIRPGTATMDRMQARIGEIERSSEHIGAFTPVMVPGLLQTEAYARCVFQSSGRPAEDVEAGVRKRLDRQQLLDDPDHRFTLVMTEGALRWQAVSPAVMADQLDRIADRARADTGDRVRIGIIPWTRAATLFPLTNFDLYDERAVVIGAGYGTSFLTRPRDVGIYVEQLRQFGELAVYGEAAAVKAERIADEYRALA